MKKNEIIDIIESALYQLITQDESIFRIKAGERSATHRLAVWIEEIFLKKKYKIYI